MDIPVIPFPFGSEISACLAVSFRGALISYIIWGLLTLQNGGWETILSFCFGGAKGLSGAFAVSFREGTRWAPPSYNKDYNRIITPISRVIAPVTHLKGHV